MHNLKTKKIIIIGLVFFLLIIILAILVGLGTKRKPAKICKLNISSSPSEASVTIENKEYKTPFAINLTRGKEYEITFKKRGFLEKTVKKQIPDKEEDYLNIKLESELMGPESIPPSEEEKIEKHYKSPLEKLKSQWLGRVWAPDYSYVIEYIPSTDKFYISIISPDCQTCKEKALAWFEKQGINPQSLPIIWLYQSNQKKAF